ncbi:hypothetical protein [Marinoscillum sp. MHG1-6]|uniref:hypothetical protein n=1 Tax=Marinoscillum sp. MHG1-6 TaxID=2959627 RepID=UPI0021587EF6|nr:hypothetical protein [Marinoscillum sp. MHG1-6]
MNRQQLVLVFLVLLIVMVGCSKGGENGPSGPVANIDLVSGGSSFGALDSVTLLINIQARSGLESGELAVNVNNSRVETLMEYATDSTFEGISEEFTFAINPDYAGKNIAISLFITDLTGLTADDTLALSIVESAINVVYQDTLGSFGGLTYGSFYDVVDDSTYFKGNLSSTEMKFRVDLVYFNTKEMGHVLAAPSNITAEVAWGDAVAGQSWPLNGVENETVLYDLGTELDFDGIATATQIDGLVPGSVAVDSVKQLSAGHVIGYELASNRGVYKGLIRVNHVSGSESGATLSFDLKSPK